MLCSSTKSGKILVVNDDTIAAEDLRTALASWGYQVDVARNAEELESRLRVGENPDLLILEFTIAGASGLDLYSELKGTLIAPVLFWTADSSIESAVAATKMGAVDVLESTTDRNKLRSVIEQTLRDLNRARKGAKANSHPRASVRTMLGSSASMRCVRKLIAEVAPTNANVLILGENGVGKELVAQEIHRQSRRCSAAFVPVDVGAISPTLLESTLFGYRKGAYTGAYENTKGSCELADGGTLFLDEIGELALALQPKLLRFLQHGVVQQLGSPVARPLDARVIAATNRDLLDMVRRKEFREDLYYRLNVFPVFVPALRDRREDVEELAQVFVRRFAQRHEKAVDALTPAAIEILVDYDWPGNIRELENLVERMVIRCRDREIGAPMVTAALVDHGPSEGRSTHRSTKTTADLPSSSYMARMDGLTEIERTQVDAIISALCKTDGNVSQAAQRLGLGQATVYRKIKKYEIRQNESQSALR